MPEIPENGPFILASASPRRRDLLRQVGLSFRIVPSELRETIRAEVEPWRHALYWAAAKAKDVAQHYPQEWVLAADTIVVLNKEILGKPTSQAEAKSMLERLNGRVHRVITGFCLVLQRAGVEESQFVETSVFMRRLSTEDIQGYIETGEPMDKAGAYGI